MSPDTPGQREKPSQGFSKIALIAWLSIVSLIVAWGPLFVADFIRAARPKVDLEGFAMGWLPVTIIGSLLSLISLLL